jgi:EAL domain-containing protein (putative c-di-GMP-specific phosphodiesterase class I)
MHLVTTPDSLLPVFAPGALRTVFQPIARRRRAVWEVAALECLTRGPAGSPWAEAPDLFAAARAAGQEAELDRACVRTALETAARANIREGLFINVLPVTLATDPGFPSFLALTAERHGIAIDRLTIEVTEHNRAGAGKGVLAGVRQLEGLGVNVAIDDFGAGPAEFHTLRLWRPRWMKLDGYLFREARRMNAAWQLIQAVVQDAFRWGVDVIAEGLERPSDLWMAAELGIEMMQGNVICAPLGAERAASAHMFLHSEQRAS